MQVRIFRRSIFVTKDMKKVSHDQVLLPLYTQTAVQGEQFQELTSFENGGNGNVRSIRPGNGLHSRHMSDIVGKLASFNFSVTCCMPGKYARVDISKGTPMDWELMTSTSVEESDEPTAKKQKK